LSTPNYSCLIEMIHQNVVIVILLNSVSCQLWRMVVNGCEWLWMVVNGCEWLWMVVNGCEWVCLTLFLWWWNIERKDQPMIWHAELHYNTGNVLLLYYTALYHSCFTFKYIQYINILLHSISTLNIFYLSF